MWCETDSAVLGLSTGLTHNLAAYHRSDRGPSPAPVATFLLCWVQQRQWRLNTGHQRQPPPRAQQWTVSSFVSQGSRNSVAYLHNNRLYVKSEPDCYWEPFCESGYYLLNCVAPWFNINAGKWCQLSTCCAIVYFCKSQCLEICRARGKKCDM